MGTEFDPTSTDDNCGVANIINDVNNSASLDATTLAVGTHTITWTVTDNKGNTETCSFNVVVDAFVGINSNSTSNTVTLYPNPAHDFLTIDFTEIQNFSKIEITDITGKVVQQLSNNNKQLTIDISNLNYGLYFIKFVANQSVEVLQFIKK